MKERPIIFTAPEVRAILAGRKTMTRRVCKGQRELSNEHDFQLDRCPYGQPGERLWVREVWAVPHRYDHLGPSNIPVKGVPTHYAATEERGGLRWRSPIQMCRWASRITLEIESVRVERLQDISEADALAEGCQCYVCGAPLDGNSEADCHCFHRTATASDYRDLWEHINGEGSWTANPWVWVLSFKRVTP